MKSFIECRWCWAHHTLPCVFVLTKLNVLNTLLVVTRLFEVLLWGRIVGHCHVSDDQLLSRSRQCLHSSEFGASHTVPLDCAKSMGK